MLPVIPYIINAVNWGNTVQHPFAILSLKMGWVDEYRFKI
jgi:hypothetical protein